MGIFGKNDPSVTRTTTGIKIGDPDPNGWTAEDLESWKFDENGRPITAGATRCNYVGGLMNKRCKNTADSGKARCAKHVGKI
jgi:hypothetical protein